MDAKKQSAVEVKFTTPISIGFYVREGQVPGTKVVFNFQTAVE